jgi:hypothetical protein
VIKRVVHPDAYAIQRSWQDEAAVTGQAYVERPWWYENDVTGQTYYDLFGCIGWPSEVSDKDDGMPGYAAVVGAVRQRTEGQDPKVAAFQLLSEMEHKDVPTLLDGMLSMREEYGFGLFPGLMQAWYGDPDRFITILALMNERLEKERGDGRSAILVTPPDDFYEQKAFDHYVRSFRSVLMPDKVRFYFGKNEILRSRLKEFRLNDPAIYSVGGLVHSLLSGCSWMDHMRDNAFVVEGENE